MTTGPHDPTRSGPPASSVAPIRFSRNEIETLSMKAARGAGMDWGLAEEAGFAAGWLAAQGIDGAGALLALLAATEGKRQGIAPVVSGDLWTAPGPDALCPIALGAALSDFAAVPEGPVTGGGPGIGPVRQPILVVPFLALLAKDAGGALSLVWPGGTLMVRADGIWPPDAADRLAAEPSATVRIDLGADLPVAPAPRPLSAVPGAIASGLNAFAMRTTVPASEASRRGAGAAAGDND